tara:strand:- start:8 stop:391 length:384 start_codon:yes stop_codon:yes gene_type:complete
MAHFAKVIDNVVQQVIVAEQDFINKLPDKDKWIQTSYNTRHGVHINGGTPLRGNFAGVGMHYNPDKDYFYHNRPWDKFGTRCDSWVFKEEDLNWHPPTAIPDDGKFYLWRESDRSWVEQPTPPDIPE